MDKYHHGDLARALKEAAWASLAHKGALGGPEDLSLRDLARQVGVSPPAVYHHFPHRQALLEALALDACDRLQKDWEGLGLGALGLAYVEGFRREPWLLDLVFSHRWEAGSAVPGRQLDLYGILEAAVIRETGLEQLDERSLLVWTVVHGLAHLYRIGALGEGEECTGGPVLWTQGPAAVLARLGPLLHRALGEGAGLA